MKTLLILSLSICASVALSSEDLATEALRECGNILHLDVHKLIKPRGEYFQSGCSLSCFEEDQKLADSSINEGFQCPINPDGICRHGKCESKVDPLKICSEKHHIDFAHVNHNGTSLSKDECAVKCAVAGHVISEIYLNEMKSCPKSSGVCYNGACVGQKFKISNLQVFVKTSKPPHADFKGALMEVNAGLFLEHGSTIGVSVEPCHSTATKIGQYPLLEHNCKAWTGPFSVDYKFYLEVYSTPKGGVHYLINRQEITLYQLVKNMLNQWNVGNKGMSFAQLFKLSNGIEFNLNFKFDLDM